MVPPGLRVVQCMKANVSATDSTIGLTSTWAGLEPSRAHAGRGCTNDRLMPITLIAIVRYDPFALLICRPPLKCCRNAALRLKKGVTDGANQQVRPRDI